MNRSIIFSFFFISLMLFVPIEVGAQSNLINCDGGPDDPCSWCNLIHTANYFISWLIGVLFVIAGLVIAWAGIKLVTSGGNVSAREGAKGLLINAIIGLIIVFAAWLIVDTIMKTLAGGDLGPWNEIECWTQTRAQAYNDPDTDPTVSGSYSYQAYIRDTANDCRQGISGSFSDEAQCEADLSSQTSGEEFYVVTQCDGSSGGTPPSWSSSPLCGGPSSPTADGVFDYQSGIAAQRGHASPALESLLTCMANTVPGNVGVISSISDSLIVNGTKTWQECAAGQCQHTAGSRHYGGSGSCVGSSYAVDFGDEQNVSELCSGANSCGSISSCSIHNGNHVHISIPISC